MKIRAVFKLPLAPENAIDRFALSFRSTLAGGLLFFCVRVHKHNCVKIFSGNSNLPLARSIASIGIELGKCSVSAFPDGETFVKIDENVRGEDVFVVQSSSPPTNHHLYGDVHHD